MATITGFSTGIQLSTFDFGVAKLLAKYRFQNNADFAYHGTTYEDVYELNEGIGSGKTYFLGKSLDVDSGGYAEGGTVQALAFVDFLGASKFQITGLSLSFKTLQKAAFSSSEDDDRALIRQALAGNDVISLSTQADSFSGFGGNDRLDGKDGNDYLDGGDGKDVLIGGSGADWLRGGLGGDVFVFRSAMEASDISGKRDRIVDFQNFADDINLALVDADEALAGNQAFRFIWNSAFHGKAGELRYQQYDNAGTANDFTLVMGDTDGDRGADFFIRLDGLKQLWAIDFML